jgi:hypothetical protein
VTISASNNTKAKARSVSASAIKRVREVRSANRPSGIDSSKNGNDWMEASKPISPGPALSKSTATMGTAARLSCSADWASKLDQARRRKEADRATDMQGALNKRIRRMRQTRVSILGEAQGPACRLGAPDQAAQVTRPK